MKALSLHQPYAWLVAEGYKTLESRTWPTAFRGDFVIQATKKFILYPSTIKILNERNITLPLPKDFVYGAAQCVVSLTHCRKFDKLDMEDVCCAWFDGYVFELENIRKVEPYPLKGSPFKFFKMESNTNNLILNELADNPENHLDDDDDEDSWQPCADCDLPDACADFGCAIEKGIREPSIF